MIPFTNNIVFVGFGAVARCVLPILLHHIKIPLKNITVIDFNSDPATYEQWVERGVTFVSDRVRPDNLAQLLGTYLSAGDVLIDLAWNIDCNEIVQWCHDNGVLYCNSSIEEWDPYKNNAQKKPTERTLYWRHMKLRELIKSWPAKSPTAVVEHGANPGLISHFTKQALCDIAKQAVADKKYTTQQGETIQEYYNAKEFNYLARELGVKVIHCSERDTQITNKPRQLNEFVNTWSIEGLREEGTTTSELGWGTHEKQLPPMAFTHDHGPKNQICLAHMGINTWVVSWVPDYTICGMIIRHGESFTISDHFTVWEHDKAVYRPTVHYAYYLCDSAMASLAELRSYNYKLVENQRILNNEITQGDDILGALVMGHRYTSWWTGSKLSIEESRRLVPGQNATTVQVAIGIVAAVAWMIEHPTEGVCVPDDLPHEYILSIAKPYLGEFISKPVDWTPLKSRHSYFSGFDVLDLDEQDPWQFKNFFIPNFS